jgi:hypothetical protein
VTRQVDNGLYVQADHLEFTLTIELIDWSSAPETSIQHDDRRGHSGLIDRRSATISPTIGCEIAGNPTNLATRRREFCGKCLEAVDPPRNEKERMTPVCQIAGKRLTDARRGSGHDSKSRGFHSGELYVVPVGVDSLRPQPADGETGHCVRFLAGAGAPTGRPSPDAYQRHVDRGPP